MLPKKDDSLIETALDCLQIEGFDGFGKMIALVINKAMQLERDKYLNASHYERAEGRTAYANGYKDKEVKTRVGALELKVPQTRDGFYPESLEKGTRSERALKLAIAEMYVQGVSTRKVAAITEKLCGFSVNTTQVSKATQELDGVFKKWRNRPLGRYRYAI